MNITMDDDKRLDALGEKLDMLTAKVGEMHAAIFGVSGQGGLHAWTRDHDKDIKELQQHKNKTIGAVSIIGVLCGILGAAIVSVFKKL